MKFWILCFTCFHFMKINCSLHTSLFLCKLIMSLLGLPLMILIWIQVFVSLCSFLVFAILIFSVHWLDNREPVIMVSFHFCTCVSLGNWLNNTLFGHLCTNLGCSFWSLDFVDLHSRYHSQVKGNKLVFFLVALGGCCWF